MYVSCYLNMQLCAWRYVRIYRTKHDTLSSSVLIKKIAHCSQSSNGDAIPYLLHHNPLRLEPTRAGAVAWLMAEVDNILLWLINRSCCLRGYELPRCCLFSSENWSCVVELLFISLSFVMKCREVNKRLIRFIYSLHSSVLHSLIYLSIYLFHQTLKFVWQNIIDICRMTTN